MDNPATEPPSTAAKIREIVAGILEAVRCDEDWPSPAQQIREALPRPERLLFEMLAVGMCQVIEEGR